MKWEDLSRPAALPSEMVMAPAQSQGGDNGAARAALSAIRKSWPDTQEIQMKPAWQEANHGAEAPLIQETAATTEVMGPVNQAPANSMGKAALLAVMRKSMRGPKRT